MYKIHYLQNKYKHLSEQGSFEWIRQRKYTFGGSEMYATLNYKKKKFINKIIYDKIHENVHYQDTTNWGKLFEPVAKIILIQEKDIKEIYEFSGIPHPKYPVAYSPDGVFIKNDDLILLEIKCPIYKHLNENIAEQYIFQIKTGMEVLPVKECLFARFRFRRCLIWSNPLDSTYDYYYHKEFGKRISKNKPITYGYLYWDTPNNLIDLATYPEMLPYIPTFKPQIIIKEEFKKNTGVVLMWKLFNTKYEEIEPEINFLQKYEKDLWTRYQLLYNAQKQIEM